MKRLLLIGIALLVLAGMACSYQGPPGGDEAYCWRVEQASRSESWLHSAQTVVFYTNTQPVEEGDSLLLANTWWATDTKNLRPSRFNNFSERITVPAAQAEVTSLCMREE